MTGWRGGDDVDAMAAKLLTTALPWADWNTWPEDGDPETLGRKHFRAMASAALSTPPAALANKREELAKLIGRIIWQSEVEPKGNWLVAADAVLAFFLRSPVDTRVQK